MNRAGALRVVAGIDEAGLGPLLGPLCLGYSVLRFPVGDKTLWQRLEPVVAGDPADRRAAFVVADSKRVFQRTERGAKRLEATALGFLAQRQAQGRLARAAQELLWNSPSELASAPCEELLAEHPWYAQAQALPRHQHAGALELAAHGLTRALRGAQVELLDLGLVVVPEAELNRSFQASGSKGATEWHYAARIVERLWRRFCVEEAVPLKLVIDRLGGRSRYGRLLESALPECEIVGRREGSQRSEYLLGPRRGGQGERLRVLFAERAEQGSFAVALASCLAKYARETAMQAFNEYFCARQSGLKPTAGYTSDGRRWLREAEAALRASGIGPERLVRTR